MRRTTCGIATAAIDGTAVGGAANQGRGECRADAGDGVKTAADFVGAVPAGEAAIENADLLAQGVDLDGEGEQAHAHDVGDAVILAVINHGDELIDAVAPDRRELRWHQQRFAYHGQA